MNKEKTLLITLYCIFTIGLTAYSIMLITSNNSEARKTEEIARTICENLCKNKSMEPTLENYYMQEELMCTCYQKKEIKNEQIEKEYQRIKERTSDEK